MSEVKNSLGVVDYYSEFADLEPLHTTTPKAVTTVLSKAFARFGTSDVTRSDSGPQFVSAEFLQLAGMWRFKHATSSSYVPKSYAEAEQAVHSGNGFLRKATDVPQALLSHKTTTQQESHSPAELVMRLELRSTVPIALANLNLRWKHARCYKSRRNKARSSEAANYNWRHRTRHRSLLERKSAV